jgi:hypothetical protein
MAADGSRKINEQITSSDCLICLAVDLTLIVMCIDSLKVLSAQKTLVIESCFPGPHCRIPRSGIRPLMHRRTLSLTWKRAATPNSKSIVRWGGLPKKNCLCEERSDIGAVEDLFAPQQAI